MNYTCRCQKVFSSMKGLLMHKNQVGSLCNASNHHLDQIRASYIPGTLAKGLAGAHFGEKDHIALKDKAVE